MKKKSEGRDVLYSQLKKIWLMMRLSILLILFTMASVSASVYSQNTRLTLKMKNSRIADVFDAIEQQSEFYFFYNRDQFDDNRIVQVEIENKPILEVLDQLFKDEPISYEIVDRNILIKVDKNGFSTSQQKTVRGRVVDAGGAPLPGVSIVIKGTTTGTITDFDGNFALPNVEADAVLVFSFVGMKTQEIIVANQSSFNIVMEEDAIGIEEVVAVGYGTQAKKDVTGSISKISTEIIEQRPVASVDNVLQGLAPGLNAGTRSNTPGQLSRITIRSIGSLTAGYEPLWVIDGFPTDQRNAQSVNPADIQSIEILKDASSTAIYGSRGANGVIIITTKKGKAGAAKLNVSVNTGIASVPEHARYDVMNAEEYVQFHTEANGGVTPDFIKDYWDGQTDTDWQDEILQTAAFHNYSLSASGGTERVSYLMSGNYTNQDGVIPGQGFEKFSARVSLEYRPNEKITFGINLAPNYSTILESDNATTDGLRGLFSSAYSQAVMLAPIIPVKRSDGTYSVSADIPGFNPLGNPLETVQRYKSTRDIFRFLGGMSLAIEPIDGLVFKSSVSANIGTDKYERIYNAPVDGISRNGYPVVSTLGLRKVQQLGWLNENTVTYKRQIGEHALNVLGGFTLQSDESEHLRSDISGLQIEGPTILSIGNSETLTSSNGITKHTLVSYLGRLNYSYKDRYLVTATVRRDGSSRFGANNRFQTFGSFALGWRLSEESFIKDLGFVDNAKLRASYGATGSNAIPNFIARPSLSPVRQAFGESQVIGIGISSPGNPNLTWETSDQLNIGLDLTLFGGRLDMILDYYNNETSSLILSRNLVASSGFTGFLTNIGSMRNKGVEISANVNVIDKNDFSWWVGGNATYNDQEILDLGGDEEIRNFYGALRRTVGGELQNIHVTRAVGIFRAGQTLADGQLTARSNPQPGDIIYEDLNGDGSISNFLGPDGQNLDGTNLDWVFAFNTKIQYKAFELSALLQGQAGGSILDLYNIQIGAPSSVPRPNVNLSKEFWFNGRYISESQPGDGRTPAAGRFNDGISTVSSLGIQKTDYVRLKNITLSYTIPKSVLSKIGIANARVYTSVENVVTWTDFIGINPDLRFISNGGPSLFGGSRIRGVSDDRELGLTIGVGNPLPRIWTFGLNFDF